MTRHTVKNPSMYACDEIGSEDWWQLLGRVGEKVARGDTIEVLAGFWFVGPLNVPYSAPRAEMRP